MKILLVGGTGAIGTAVGAALADAGHDVLSAGYSGGALRVDLSDKASLSALYQAVGPVDAVVCTAGVAKFGSLGDLDDRAFDVSIANKLMGQVNLVRVGVGCVVEGGSFTFTTGTLSTRPTPGTSAVAMVGAGVEGFVRAAALDLDGRYRVNAVSPGALAESRVARGLEPMPGIWGKDLARYYVQLVEGTASGTVVEAEAPLVL